MKQNKLLTLSLLASFLLLISASYSTAANTVTYGTVDVCPKPAGAIVYVPVEIGNDVDLSALDLVGQIIVVPPGNVTAQVTAVTFDNRMSLADILDQRYPIGDLGGGLFRLGAAKVSGYDLTAGTGRIATLTCQILSNCKLGSVTLEGATTNCGGHDVATAFVDKNANSIVPTVGSGAINVVNTLPAITNCPTVPFEVYWNNVLSYAFTATDADLACGCDALTFSKVSGPGTITPGGVYVWTPPGDSVGCRTVVVKVADNFGGEALCTFQIKVLNHPPVITCPGNAIILQGDLYTGTATATDEDSGPKGMLFSLVSFTGPGTMTVDPITGVINWQSLDLPAYIGTWTATISVTDQANIDACNLENSDVCSFTITVLPKFVVKITKAEGDEETNFKGVLQGHYVDIPVYLDVQWPVMMMGGYDFLITYDVPALSFVSAAPGEMLTDCNWEYFTYRFGPFGNCGNACPSGLLRIVAMAETNNGPYHPTCFNNVSSNELAVLKFLVTNDRTYECMFAPISFYWLDCGDNTISSKFGDSLYLADEVFFFDYTATPPFAGYPSMYGTSDDCLEGDKVVPLRAINFIHGGVDIVCSEDIDARGDINVNGLADEIADAVMFTNYFVMGLGAFGDHVEASIAASDVNADGTVLSVADLVYLIRVINGDASPYPKEIAGVDNIVIKTQQMNNQMTVSYEASTNAGAALFVFEVNGTIENVTTSLPMEVKYAQSGNELRVLVYDMKNAIPAGSNTMLTIPVNGSLELKEAEVADYYGNVMTVNKKVLPTSFALMQNYPNPFNPTTTIALALPVASDYSVVIYNVAGQVIRNISGSSEAGVVQITWDGQDESGNQVASGIYFYKAAASNFVATKKMVLMK